MGITVKATLHCDRCGREQEIDLSGRVNADTQAVMRDANASGPYGWAMVDRNGREVYDSLAGAPHLLCKGCADEYRRFIKEQERREREFFGRGEA